MLVCYLDGLRFQSNGFDERILLSSLADRENNSASPARRTEERQQQILSSVRSIFSNYVLPHHPKSSEFADVLVPKVGLFALSVLLSGGRCLLATSLQSYRTSALFWIFEISLFLLWWCWLLMILQVNTNAPIILPAKMMTIAFRLIGMRSTC